MGDQRIFGSKICPFGSSQKLIKNCLSRAFSLREGRCDARSIDVKHSKFSPESNGFIQF
jgi:hypothetical protein